MLYLQYPKILCPICNFKIGSNDYKRHIKICEGKPPQGYEDKVKYVVCHDGLNCIFCNKLCKNLNSLTQHEIRYALNPNRRSYNNLGEYSSNCRKGQTKDTMLEIAQQRNTLLTKYANGYISPAKGRKNIFEYIYKEYNDSLINKWRAYVSALNIEIPEYDVILHRGSYNSGNGDYKCIRRARKLMGADDTLLFEHDFIANLLLDGRLLKTNTVHHIDRNGMNNDPFNLMIFATNGDYKRFHNSKYVKLIYDEETHLFSSYLDKESANNTK